MNDMRVNRWMGPLGIVILLLIFLAFGPLGGNNPGENASGASVVSYWNAHQDLGWLQIYLVGAALLLTLLYVSQLRTVLISNGAGHRFFPNAAFGAGLLFVAGFIVSGSFHMTIILAAHNHQLAIAKVLNFYDRNNELMFLAGASFLTLCTGAAILQGSRLPRWLGIVSLVIGAVSVAGPFSFFGFLAMGIWFPLLGFVIAAKFKSSDEVVPSKQPVADRS